MQGEPCALAADCHPEVDAVYAVCVDGTCRVFDQASGYGSAIVNLSFERMYQAFSGYVHFLLARAPDGQVLTCEQVVAGEVDLRAVTINRLTIQPKYLVFHWNGDPFFPNNLIQFIRPGDEVLAVAEGYAQFEGQGPLTAIGCEPDVTIETDQTAEFSISLAAP